MTKAQETLRDAVLDSVNTEKNLTRDGLRKIKGVWKKAKKLPDNPMMKVSSLDPYVFADAFAHIEKWNIPVSAVVMSPNSYRQIFGFPSFILDKETRAAYLREGFVGKMWGASIIVNGEIDSDETRVLGQKPNGSWVHQRIRVVK